MNRESTKNQKINHSTPSTQNALLYTLLPIQMHSLKEPWSPPTPTTRLPQHHISVRPFCGTEVYLVVQLTVYTSTPRW